MMELKEAKNKMTTLTLIEMYKQGFIKYEGYTKRGKKNLENAFTSFIKNHPNDLTGWSIKYSSFIGKPKIKIKMYGANSLDQEVDKLIKGEESTLQSFEVNPSITTKLVDFSAEIKKVFYYPNFLFGRTENGAVKKFEIKHRYKK